MASQLERLQAVMASGNLSDDQTARVGVLVNKLQAPPPIPDPVLPDKLTIGNVPETLPELTGGIVTRPAAEIAGSLGGIALTSPTGLLAPIIGGALGAAAGSALYDTVEDALRGLGVLATPIDQKTGFERVKEVAGTAASGAALDAAFAGGGQVVGTVFRSLKPAVGNILGVRSEAARAITEQADKAGLLVGAAEVGNLLPKAIERVIGVFPLVSQPIKKARGRIIETAENRLASLINTFAPNSTLQSKLSVDMFKAAKGARKEFMTTAGRLYDNFRSLAAAAGDNAAIPTEGLRALGKAAREADEAGRVLLKGGKELKSPVADPINDFVKTLEDLPENLSVTQFTKLGRDLEKSFRKLAADGFDVRALAEVKDGLEGALAQIDVSKAVNGEKIKEALRAANSFYTKIAKFQTPTGKKFGRVDKKVFEAGRVEPGTINADEVFGVVVNLRSSDAVKDLRKLVGKDLIRQTGRKIVENAIAKATPIKNGVPGLPDFDAVRKALGQVGPEGRVRNEALEEILGSKNLNLLDDTLSVASKISAAPAVSQFIARRATLGGAAAVAGAFAFGGGVVASGGMVGALGLTLLARHLGKLATNPEALKQMQRVILNPDIALGIRRNALSKLAKGVAQTSLAEKEKNIEAILQAGEAAVNAGANAANELGF